MRKIILFLLFMFGFISFSFALSKEDFSVSNEEFFKAWSSLKLNIKDKKLLVKNLKLKVWDAYFEKLANGQNNVYEFQVPEKYYITPVKNHIKVYLNWKSFDIGRLPIFTSIDLNQLTWWKQVELAGYFTGSCNLILSDKSSLGLQLKWNYAYATIPKDLKNDIIWWYVRCGNLNSNWLDFHIYKAPVIKYVISEDKKAIKPWTKILIKWEYFQIDKDDKVSLFINNKEITWDVYILNQNSIRHILPNKNLWSISLKVSRNGFESNSINLTVSQTPYIDKVNIVSNHGKKYFRLIWYFPKQLWDVNVYYGWTKLSIHEIKENYVDVDFPVMTLKKAWDFTCSYYLKPAYFSVSVWNQKSNNYFYYKESSANIKYIDKMICSNNNCKMNIYFNTTNIYGAKVLLNGQKADISFNGSKWILYNWNLVKLWTLQVVSRDCSISPDYEFDFISLYKPVIREVVSKKWFTSADEIEIYGDRLNYDGTFVPQKPKLSLNPDISEKWKEILYGRESATVFLKNQLIKWTKVKISFSNIHWNSNDAYFIVGWNKKYIWAPVIYWVSYENGGEWGQKVHIKWLNFSEHCNKDEIYFWKQVVYPDDCSYTDLVFTIPKNEKVDSIFVKVNDQKSENYRLNSKIWWTLINDKKFEILTNDDKKIFDVRKESLSQKMNFKINNTRTDLLLSRFKIFVKTDEVLPFYNFKLSINGDDSKYFYSNEQKRFIKSNKKNTPYVQKVDGWYILIFDNQFIPFSTEPINIELSFDTNRLEVINNKIYSFIVPSQKIYYYNIYKDVQKPLNMSVLEKRIIQIKTLNEDKSCFDTDSYYKNCALVLKWQEVEFEKAKKQTIHTTNTNKSTTHTQTSTHTMSKIEKIARKLNLSLMKKINIIVKKIIIKKRNQYRTNRIKYMQVYRMYKQYRNMRIYTKSDLNSKMQYVKYLIGFVREYKKLIHW